MATFRGESDAFGHPGIIPKWSHGDKDAVGTAYAASSRMWFTLWRGIVTELYYPTVDRAQTRDLQFLVTDGETFFHEERRHLDSRVERIEPSLGFHVRSADPEGRYLLEKRVITDPHLPCLLVRTRVTGPDEALLARLKLYALCAPHLDVGGRGNNAYVVESAGRQVLVANRNRVWLAMGATVPFSKCSCGYVGESDGWNDVNKHLGMQWQFDRALDGNVALTGEIALAQVAGSEFTLGVALGDGLHCALTTLFQGLGVPFEEQLERFKEQWARPARSRQPLEAQAGDGGKLYRSSVNVLLAHEDKTFQGALIASLSIPWGQTRHDEEAVGGYHLVWTRDMYHSATGLLAAGNRHTPLRALIYLATSQLPDGSFPQNFWVDGTPHWTGVQLDEVAFPVLLAHRLWREKALDGFDPWPMVRAGAAFLLRQGPVTQQERWEENGGYSPSTLAVTVAALVCAADFARDRNDATSADLLEQYADHLESSIERWTVTQSGTLLPGVGRHYVRINPATPGDPAPDAGVAPGVMVRLANQPPDLDPNVPACDLVDAGFLELVRFGLRWPDDPLIVDSLRVVDHVLKVDAPAGPCWRRYNRDGYGEDDEGRPYTGHGSGHAWPLLTSERAHYELAAAGDYRALMRAVEAFATPTGLLPEQVWDRPDLPQRHLCFGKPTGAAVPLLWAHAEYVKLLRSARDGVPFDRVPVVEQRYLGGRERCHLMRIWSFRCPVTSVPTGHVLRIQADAPFHLRWTGDGWATSNNTDSRPTPLGVHFFDLPVPRAQQAPLTFTFHWPEADKWEGRDFVVNVVPPAKQQEHRLDPQAAAPSGRRPAARSSAARR